MWLSIKCFYEGYTKVTQSINLQFKQIDKLIGLNYI